jgi:hypothetical protein
MIFLMLVGQMARRTFVSSKKSVGLFDRGRPLPRLAKSINDYYFFKKNLIL